MTTQQYYLEINKASSDKIVHIYTAYRYYMLINDIGSLKYLCTQYPKEPYQIMKYISNTET